MSHIWMPDLVIYHAHCNDGFAAAWSAHMRWSGADIVYHPATCGSLPPSVAGLNVLIADFSYDAETLKAMGQVAKSIIVLDHHETAMTALAEFMIEPGIEFSIKSAKQFLAIAKRKHGVPVCAQFDMKRSGARMAWEFCNAGKEPPEFIYYIEDHDLYSHLLADSQAVSMAVSSYPKTFEAWTAMSCRKNGLLTDGKAILRAWRQGIGDLLQHAVEVRIAGEKVPALNLPPNMAALGGEMLIEAHKQAPFVATWFGRGARDQWSLRSGSEGAHVGNIAKRYGGGGHPHAAGFHVAAGAAALGVVHEATLQAEVRQPDAEEEGNEYRKITD